MRIIIQMKNAQLINKAFVLDNSEMIYRKTVVDIILLQLLNPEKPDVPLNKNDAFQKVQKRRVQEKR